MRGGGPVNIATRMSVDQMAKRQLAQLEQLDKLQSSLDSVKKRAAGPAGPGEEGTLLNRVSG